MKKTFLMTAAAVAIFAVACEKDEINDLQNQVNINKSEQIAGDNANADALAVESARLQSIIDLNKIAQEEGDDAIRAAIEAHVAAIEASIIEASEEAAANLAAARAEVLELLAAAQADINVRLEDLASVDVELAEADADLQDALDTAQTNLDSAIADLEAADESNLAEALEAVAVARAAAEAAIADVELEGGKDGLSELAVQELIDEAIKAIPAADLSELIERLDVLEAVEVPAGFDDADLIESIALVQEQIDDLVIQSVDDINKFIADAIADLADNSDISGLQSQIDAVKLELENLPNSYDDSDVQEKLTDLQNQINIITGTDYYTYTEWSPDFVAQTATFQQTRTASLTIVGLVDSPVAVAEFLTQDIVVSSSAVTSTVNSADIAASDRVAEDTDGTGTYVQTVTTYSAVGFVNTHSVTSYGGYIAAADVVDPEDGYTKEDLVPTQSGGVQSFANNGDPTVDYLIGETVFATLDLAKASVTAGSSATIVTRTTQPRVSNTTAVIQTQVSNFTVFIVGVEDVPAKEDYSTTTTSTLTAAILNAAADDLVTTNDGEVYEAPAEVNAEWTEVDGVYSNTDYTGSFTLSNNPFSGHFAQVTVGGTSVNVDPTNVDGDYYLASDNANTQNAAIAAGKRAIIALQ